MKKQISSKTISLIFAVIVICFAIGFYIYAWTEPTEAPPGGNVPAPLNTGIDGQSKEGGLLLGNSSTVTNGLIVRYGNVGIGTTEPEKSLHVYSNPYHVILGWGGVDIRRDKAAIDANSALGGISFRGTETGGGVLDELGALIRAMGDGDWSSTSSPGRLHFYTTPVGSVTSGIRMTILSGGNVGIGTTNPGYKLDVNGDINLPATGFLRIAGNAGSSGQVLTRTATGMAWQAGAAGGIGGSGTDNYIPRWNGATNLENSIIYQTDAGNVGIGINTPSQKLDVAGQIHATGDICTDAGGGVCLSTGGGGGGDSFADSVSKNIDTTYTAATSGILVVRAYIRARYEHNYVEIRSDNSATPTTVVGHIGAWCNDNCNTGIYHTMSVPILKGKNYRVVVQSISGAEYVIVDAIQFYPNK